MFIVESVEHDAKCMLSGLQAKSDIAAQDIVINTTYFGYGALSMSLVSSSPPSKVVAFCFSHLLHP
jgi:hypothetical protein